jgi:hypothetical protein
MRHLTSGVFCLALAVLLAGGALCLVHGRAGNGGPWGPPTILDEVERANRLAAEDGVALRRMAVKEAAAEEAAAGRLPLLEAAARFRDSDADVPESYRSAWRLTIPGGSEDERYCRQVLLYVGWLERHGEARAAALDRLQAELDEALARGDLRLPD